jgi:hypothetical protein
MAAKGEPQRIIALNGAERCIIIASPKEGLKSEKSIAK